MKLKITAAFLLIFVSQKSFGQASDEQYRNIVYDIKGDLNKDGLADKVVVRENDNDSKHPYLLEIFFKNVVGSYKKVLRSTKAVTPKFPGGGEISDVNLENLEIKSGLLIFTNQLIRGNYVHKFRFQNGNFELIGFTENNASAGYIEYVDYNLSTGIKINEHIDYQTDKVLMHKKSIEKLKPLPKLQDFELLEFVY
ncbi:hypothetical protein [Soonwooa sp.]|uniref:hypothetical protein n=1 Tax=Soonwooa sp. TaxID=1938592 RepID=UPI0035AF9C56